MEFALEPANDRVHKWVAVFTDRTTKRERRVPFGQFGASDFTLNKDPLRKQNYLNRHRPNEDWNNPFSAGALSRWILWNTPRIQTNTRLFREKFKFLS